MAGAVPGYRELSARFLDGAAEPDRAPVPDDLAARPKNLKASAYFLHATLAGVRRLQAVDWTGAEPPTDTHAFVFLIEFGREPKASGPGAERIRGSNVARTDPRCTEMVVVMAGYVRALGWSARGHFAGDAQVQTRAESQADTQVDIDRMAQRAGLVKALSGVLAMPFSKRGFRRGVVTADYPLEAELPIAPDASLDWPDESAYTGTGGTRPGFEDAELAQRTVRLGRYALERIKRFEQPTTLILRDEIRRAPKRADLFTRALAGDLS